MPVRRLAPTTGREHHRRLWLGGLAAFLSGCVYLNALHNPFVYDDVRTVIDNPSIEDVRELGFIIGREATRPLVNFSYAVDRAVWGAGPFGFHLTSILLHVVNVGLLFALTWTLTADRRRRRGEGAPTGRATATAFGAAALFGLHPVMTESVGYVSGRAEVLCALFFLSALMVIRRWILDGGVAWLAGALVLWAAALASKEVAIMWPLVVFAYDLALGPNDDSSWTRRLWRFHLPLIAMTVLAGIARVAVLVLVENPGEGLIEWRHTLVEAVVTWRYVQLLVYPVRQSIFHQVAAVTSLLDPMALLAVGGLVCWGGAVWRIRRRDGIATLGTLWFFLLVAPAAALVVMNLGEPMAEHRVYLASAGFFLLAGSGMGWLWQWYDDRARSRRIGLRLLLAGLLTVLGGLTVHRNDVWRSPVRLWTDAVTKAPDIWVPRVMLGQALQESGRGAEAVEAYEQAIRLRPDEPVPYMRLGLALAELGQLDGARVAFTRLKAIEPDSIVARNGLGAVAMLAKDSDEARRQFEEALQLAPNDITARQSLALLYETLTDQPGEALRLCEEVRQLAPGTPGVEDCIRRNRNRLDLEQP